MTLDAVLLQNGLHSVRKEVGSFFLRKRMAAKKEKNDVEDPEGAKHVSTIPRTGGVLSVRLSSQDAIYLRSARIFSRT